MPGRPVILPSRHIINIALSAAVVLLVVILVASESHFVFWLIVLLFLLLDVTMIIPIGGADMAGLSPCSTSIRDGRRPASVLHLIIWRLLLIGALVGSSGAMLSYIICKRMNRSFVSVILGGFAGEEAAASLCWRRRAALGQTGIGWRCGLYHEKCIQSHHCAGLRHGGCAGLACLAGNG